MTETLYSQFNIHKCLEQGSFADIEALITNHIEEKTACTQAYWILGVSLCCQNRIEEGILSWSLGLSLIDDSAQTETEFSSFIRATIEILNKGNQRKACFYIEKSLLFLEEFDTLNFLRCIRNSYHLELWSDFFELFELIKETNINHDSRSASEEYNLISRLIKEILLEAESINNILSLDFIFWCLKQLKNSELQEEKKLKTLSKVFVKLQSIKLPDEIELEYLGIYHNFFPDNQNITRLLIAKLSSIGRYEEAIHTARIWKDASNNLIDKLYSNYFLSRSLISSGGYWDEAYQCHLEQIYILEKIVKKSQDLSHQQMVLDHEDLIQILTCTAIHPYFEDEPESVHRLRSQISQLKNKQSSNQFSYIHNSKSSYKMRVGYISSCFKRHSITWLSRWLFKYHNKEKYEVYSYTMDYSNDDLARYIASNSNKHIDLSSVSSVQEVVEIIRNDQVDILIDLDSLTSPKICNVLSRRVAPLQITWLGSDASGVPNVDFYIADQDSLPEEAELFYSTPIYRMESPYVAVEGFEIGIPSLNRRDLEIPDDAITYFSSQNSYKRNPEFVRLQMRIIKQVPNSYFLIRGLGNQSLLERFFRQLANEEGIKQEKLRFLPIVDCEETHRANLQLADIVLDTFPYNGATTTLETLWMNIPIVTRVGKQFAARNTYTFMKSVGVSEGICQTDDEYLEWGIRLGTDHKLRNNIVQRLIRSRSRSPLWNANLFTLNFEDSLDILWKKQVATFSHD